MNFSAFENTIPGMKLTTISKTTLMLAAACSLLLLSCREPEYIYELNNEIVTNDNIVKSRLKTESEFISTAYSDLFDKPVSKTELEDMLYCFNSVNDNEIVSDLYIRDLIKRNNNNIPDDGAMRNAPEEYVLNTYKKLYHRNPSEYELWHLSNLISTDTTYTSKMVYYAFMSSEEYKYF